MTVIPEIKKEENLDILQKRFFNLLEELEIYEVKEKLVSLSKQLREITEDWHTSLEPKIPLNEEDLEYLKKLVGTHSDLVDGKDFEENIINAYLLNKPGSSFQIDRGDPKRIDNFIAELRPYFFVDFIITTSMQSKYTWTIYISRLKDRNEMAVAHHHKYNGNHNLYANSIGSYSGYTSKQTWHYCKVEGFHDLIK